MHKCEFIGEAMLKMKKIIYFLLITVSFLGFSQNENNSEKKIYDNISEMSDDQLLSYWESAQSRGYTIEQIKLLARSQGASESDIEEFEKRISEITELDDKSEEDFESVKESLTSIFGLVSTEEDEDEDDLVYGLNIFGAEFFNNPNINSVPQLNIATPSSYEIGPGDELLISVWGSAENEYTTKVTREGYVKIERIGPVYISGLKISEAKDKLRSKLSKIYSGINNNNYKVFFDLSLLKSRSIVVNIAGNVYAPGAYTLSSLTSILNALYAAGGPTDGGSFRAIKLIRNGAIKYEIDLYDYFVKGELNPISLKDQDVILVPPYNNRVFVNGEFKKNGIYELKEGETIGDLLSFNGGINSFGVKNQVFIKRIEGVGRVVENVFMNDYGSFVLQDGDVIESRVVNDRFANVVTVEGAVQVPGDYAIESAKTVLDLIELSNGLKAEAFESRAYIVREDNGLMQDFKTIDLRKVLSKEISVDLKPNDVLYIPSLKDLKETSFVEISGEVRLPGSYRFFSGITVVDLILMAKGLNESASLDGISIYRSTYDEFQQNPVEVFEISLNNGFEDLNSDQNFKLKTNDLVVIRSKGGYQEKEYVDVIGLVKKPGAYAIKNNNYSMYELIEDFGGFLPDAELSGVKVKRPNNVKDIQKIVDDIEDDSLEIKIDDFIEIGINIEKILKSKGDLDQYNLVLKSGDEIVVPRLDNSVEISGEIQKPTALSYSKSLSVRKVINGAGGFGPNAKKNSVYVVYQNGNIASTRSFLIFKKYPNLLPGSKVFVPKKSADKSKISVSEIVGYTTSLVSVFAIIKSL